MWHTAFSGQPCQPAAGRHGGGVNVCVQPAPLPRLPSVGGGGVPKVAGYACGDVETSTKEARLLVKLSLLYNHIPEERNFN